MDQAWADDRHLASAIADGVVVLAPGGQIVWANEAFCQLLGRDMTSLLGTNGLDLVHPDELHRAADGIVYASQFPGRTSVAPYRVLAGDGSWLDIELKSGTVDRFDGEHLVLLIRDGTPRLSIKRALRSVAQGDDLSQTAEILLDAVTSRWPHTGAAISLPAVDGTQKLVSTGLPPFLRDHAAGLLDPETAGLPPRLLATEGGVAVLDRIDLAPSLAEEARAAGFEGCAVATVGEPGDDASLIVWFDHTIVARLEFVHAGGEIVELLGLAVERHNQLRQLWHVARHDSLTGLFNRAGFLERFEADVRAARAEPEQVMGVLYIDLDGLKEVNDRGGHASGDHLLELVAERLRAAAPPDAIVARLGGDEFVVAVCVGTEAPDADVEALAERLVEALTLVVAPDGIAVQVTASVGVALDTAPDEDPARLLERADAAMYRAKVARAGPGGTEASRSRWSR